MSPITKEQLRERARAKVKSLEFSITQTAFADSRSELEEELELARIALASLEAKDKIPELRQVIYHFRDWNEGFPIERFKADYVISWMLANYPPAQPTAVSVPEMKPVDLDEGFDEWYSEGESGADSVAPEWFSEAMKPVFLGTWRACRAAMLQGADGNSPAHSGCRPAQNCISPAQCGNSPMVPDGWVACSERMPEDDDFVYIWPRPDFGVELHVAQYGKFDKRDAGWYAQVYEQNYGIEYYPVRVTHWMPLPAAPQQE
ncbi:DUF551 domain-containing protein [Enterobacter hormaechei]|uniref:DUF551 domain-containing protein n=1 Tax=Enterobacter hormaechei TaxID=158836 RepID=UPI001E4A6CBB|nr:DUF551 domain-containing protein [Enterobacter hormaechei]